MIFDKVLICGTIRVFEKLKLCEEFFPAFHSVVLEMQLYLGKHYSTVEPLIKDTKKIASQVSKSQNCLQREDKPLYKGHSGSSQLLFGGCFFSLGVNTLSEIIPALHQLKRT